MIDLSAREDLQQLPGVVASLRRALPLESRPLLVGATARDILLSFAHGIQLERATLDIDFAFAIKSWKNYTEMRDALVASGEFTLAAGHQNRMVFRGGTRVDFIVFGDVEGPDHKIAWPPDGDVVMNVSGYREAMADAIQVSLPGGERVDVISLPALALLKLFAWRDRRNTVPAYGKDAMDLWSVLANYRAAGNDGRAYDEAAHLLDEPDYDYLRVGAWLLGKDVRTLLSNGDGIVLESALELLAAEVNSESLDLARDMRNGDTQVAVDLLRAMISGVRGDAKP